MEALLFPDDDPINTDELYRIDPEEARQEIYDLWLASDLRELSTGPEGLDVQRLAHEVSVVIADNRFREFYRKHPETTDTDVNYRHFESVRSRHDKYVMFGQPRESDKLTPPK